MTFNQITLIGNFGKEPEVRPLNEGKVASFSIATTESKKDNTGKWQDESKWWDCQAFGRTAELVEAHCTKGTQVAIVGRITYRDWQDKQGQTRRAYEVIVDRVILLSRTRSEQSQGQQQSPQQESKQQMHDVFNNMVQQDAKQEELPF